MVQQLPQNDSFDEGGLASGTEVFHGNWIRIRPWTGNASFTLGTSPTTVTHSLYCGLGTLHDGYKTGQRDPGFAGPYVISSSVLQRPAVFYGDGYGAATPDSALYAAVFRQSVLDAQSSSEISFANVAVTAEFKNLDYSATPTTNNTLLYAGVIARYRQSTIVDGVATAATLGGANNGEASVMGTEHLSGGSCYMAGFFQQPGATNRHWAILKVVNGTVTVLASQRAPQQAHLTFANLRRIELTVSGTGSVVSLQLTIYDTSVIQQVGSPTTTLVLTAVDNSSPLTNVGRHGVFASRPRNGQVALIDNVELKNLLPLGGTTREEWYRGSEAAEQYGYRTVADDLGVTGRNLHCRYVGDAYSVAGLGWGTTGLSANRALKLDTVSGDTRLTSTSAGATIPKADIPRIDLLPSLSSTADNRSCTFVVTNPSVSGTDGEVAIVARAKLDTGATFNQTKWLRGSIIVSLRVTNNAGTPQYFLRVELVGNTAVTASSQTGALSGTALSLPTSWTDNTVKVTMAVETYSPDTASVYITPRFGVDAATSLYTGSASSGTGVTLSGGQFIYFYTGGQWADTKSGSHAAFLSSGGTSVSSSHLDNNWKVGVLGSGLDLRMASQFLYIVSRTDTQLRMASQFLYIVSRTDTQLRMASQFLYIVSRTQPQATAVLAFGPTFTFSAGAISSIDNTTSLTVAGPSFFFTGGDFEFTSIFKPVTLVEPPAGQVSLSGVSCATMVAAGVEAGQIT